MQTHKNTHIQTCTQKHIWKHTYWEKKEKNRLGEKNDTQTHKDSLQNHRDKMEHTNTHTETHTKKQTIEIHTFTHKHKETPTKTHKHI